MLLASGVSRMKASDANAVPRSSQLFSDEPDPELQGVTESEEEIHSLYTFQSCKYQDTYLWFIFLFSSW